MPLIVAIGVERDRESEYTYGDNDRQKQTNSISRSGAAEMFLTTHQHPASMRDEIVSPAGTTAHANHALEKGGFRNTVVNAVEAATLR